jgi:hypothetical protein
MAKGNVSHHLLPLQAAIHPRAKEIIDRTNPTGEAERKARTVPPSQRSRATAPIFPESFIEALRLAETLTRPSIPS